MQGEEEEEEESQKEALAQHAKDRTSDAPYSDIVSELVQLQVLYQTEQDNGHLSKPCHEFGHKDLCDELICDFDGSCRSGCCS